MVAPYPQHSTGARVTSISRFVVPISAAMLLACGSSQAGKGERPASDRVTRSEIVASSAANAYDLIERLRPNWLRVPSTGSLSGIRNRIIVVYLDGQRLGDTQSLRSLSVTAIQSMQWLDATRAETVLHEVGSQPIGGAILIKTQ